jgi:hypothetical protein
MLGALAILLSVVAYGAFYVGAPGRQSKAPGPSRLLLGAGTVLTVVALALSVAATRSAVGPALVLTVMMAVASALAMIGPFLLPDAETARPRPSPAPQKRSSSRPAPRPPNLPPNPDR